MNESLSESEYERRVEGATDNIFDALRYDDDRVTERVLVQLEDREWLREAIREIAFYRAEHFPRSDTPRKVGAYVLQTLEEVVWAMGEARVKKDLQRAEALC